MTKKGSGKYTGIVTAIALFIALDAAVLMANFYMANQFARDTEMVNLAARQQTLSQQTVKALLQTDNALGSGDRVDAPLAEFKASYQLFDETLQAFRQGGEITTPDGARALIAPLADPVLMAEVDQAASVWAAFKDKSKAIFEFEGKIEIDADFQVGADEAALEGAMFEAIIYSAENQVSERLLEHINRVAVGLERKAAARAFTLQVVQVAGICLALGAFFLIVFYFLRNLRRSDVALAKAEQQKDEILDTVNEGLLLLDGDLRIGSEYSRAVETIFRRDQLHGERFVDVLKEIVPEKTLETARDYIELFFGGRVNEKLVDDLNPLDQVEVHFKDAGAGFVTRYLGFSFKRVVVNGELTHLLVTVNDITEIVALKRLLDQSKDQGQTQLDMLMDILHIEPTVLNDFLSEADERLEGINAVLKRSGKSQSEYQEKLDDIFRRVHSLKGEAGAMGLTSIADLAHELESKVTTLKDNANLSGGDFLPLTMRLDELMSHLLSVRKLIDKLIKFRGAVRAQAPDNAGDEQTDTRQIERTSMPDLFSALATRLASEENKKVAVVCHGFELAQVPEQLRKAVKDMSIQFIRNGVIHGIESPEERLQAQKDQQGRLSLTFQRVGEYYELGYRDDGRGLLVEKIRAAALSRGFVSADQIHEMDDRQVMSLIFRRGFSTAAQVDGNAGRGVGMDIVRHLINELGGRVKMSTAAGQYTAFKIQLPVTQATAVQAA